MDDGTIWFWIIFGGIIFVGWIANVVSEKKQAERRSDELSVKNQELRETIGWWEQQKQEFEQEQDQLGKKQRLFKQLFRERTQHYPVVGQIWSELIRLTDEERERALKYKKRPALRAAEEVKEIKQEKRALVKELTYWKYKSRNYEAIYPWLAEELEQDIQDEVDAEIYYTVYTEKEREDPVTQFISPEDYRKLSVTERNQRALDRYWQRGKKTKWMIGKMYERYVGYLYEKDGWDVEYFGIHKRFEDLGRDLIARKDREIHVVQCKNWSKFKTIYENHIFQLFGTTYTLQKENKGKTVTPVFYSSTVLSDTATEFAKRLGIQVHQQHTFRLYPAIKCNISSNGEKIYHLPFDQQYDTTRVTPKTGEFYAESVRDAEERGFRRAFRWSGKAT